MAKRRVYRLHRNGAYLDSFGPYYDERRLIAALREINAATNVLPGEITVHVYEKPEGIGRRYLGPIDATTILMTGEVNEDRLT
jgi:hypothetical protein